MRVPVGVETFASTRETVPFRCGACGHRQRAEVLGVSKGMQSFLNAPGTARRRAEEGARREVGRTIRFATCPRCGERSGYLRFMSPYLWAFGITLAISVGLGYAPIWFDINMSPGDKQLCATYVTWGLIALAILIVGGQLWSRWAANDRRVRWLDER